MTEIELIELIENVQEKKAETQKVELKAARGGCPKRLYDTISAFSNQDDGGILVFGIDEEKGYKVVGVYDPQDLQKKVNEQCKQMSPVVRPVFTIALIDENTVVSAEIPSIDISERPCYYSGVGRVKGSYIRVGDSDETMSEYEIYSYEAFRRKYEDDIRITTRAEMKAIDNKKLTAYIEKIKEKNSNLSKLLDVDIYKFLNMVIDDKPTLVCTLLFSFYPQMFYPQYTINAMVIMGYEKGGVDIDGARFADNRRIEGTIEDVLDETLRFLTKNMSVKTIIDSHTGKRSDKSEYPVIALRETILNALIHRDYSIHTEAMPIEVIMYKDRLEIKNPGGLYGRLSIDNLGKVQPDTRNPVLARALETLVLTENRYSGIPTIRREMKEAGMIEPVFKNSRREFMVTLYNDEVRRNEDEPNNDHKLLLEFCKKPRTRNEIARFLEITTIYWVMQNYINPLLDEGKLLMTRPEVPKSKNQKYYSTF